MHAWPQQEGTCLGRLLWQDNKGGAVWGGIGARQDPVANETPHTVRTMRPLFHNGGRGYIDWGWIDGAWTHCMGTRPEMKVAPDTPPPYDWGVLDG